MNRKITLLILTSLLLGTFGCNIVDDPLEIKEGMVFALETYCPATDGISAARIEEEVVVTNDGCRVITLFPAQELPIANRY